MWEGLGLDLVSDWKSNVSVSYHRVSFTSQCAQVFASLQNCTYIVLNARRLYCLLIHKFTYLLQCKCISRCHLVRMYASAQATLCYMGTQSPLSGAQQPTPNFRPVSILEKRSAVSATAEYWSYNFGHFSCMTASNLTKITETPQRRRTMFVVARIDAFSVSVWKCSVINRLLSRRTDGRSKSKAKICGETFTRAQQSVSGRPFVQELSSSWDGRPWSQ